MSTNMADDEREKSLGSIPQMQPIHNEARQSRQSKTFIEPGGIVAHANRASVMYIDVTKEYTYAQVYVHVYSTDTTCYVSMHQHDVPKHNFPLLCL